MRKILHILTGPPGSGKTTYAKTNPILSHLPVYDCDLGNKNGWRTSHTDCILMTSAPGRAQKQYWLDQAIILGFLPLLTVIAVPRMVAYDRMRNRSGLSKTERNDLAKSVERWYKLYQRHSEEEQYGEL